METSSKTPVNTSSVSTNAASGTSTSGNASSTDSGDIYEFKSSKEPTPVRGASSSPNPDKDKDGGKSSNGQNNHGGDNNASGSSISINEAITTPLTTDEVSTASMSPTAKRNFEGDNVEEQDEEVRRKKRKDSENTKETAKANTLGRQNINRNAVGGGEKVRIDITFVCIFSFQRGDILYTIYVYIMLIIIYINACSVLN